MRYGRVRLYSISRLQAAQKAGFHHKIPNLSPKTIIKLFLKILRGQISGELITENVLPFACVVS